MKKHVTRDANELSKLFGLGAGSAIEAELKASLMIKIREEIEKKKLTHLEVSKLSGVGRTVVTGIVNCSIQRVTIDRLVKVLASLGVRAEFKFKRVA
jgi:predicted XRE-type DNA-binding protein